MKLYAFQPESRGPYSFFVMAENEAEAIQAVKNKYHQDLYLPDFLGGREKYEISVFEKGQVVENTNS